MLRFGFALGLISGVLLTITTATAIAALRDRKAQSNSIELLQEEVETQQLAETTVQEQEEDEECR